MHLAIFLQCLPSQLYYTWRTITLYEAVPTNYDHMCEAFSVHKHFPSVQFKLVISAYMKRIYGKFR